MASRVVCRNVDQRHNRDVRPLDDRLLAARVNDLQTVSLNHTAHFAPVAAVARRTGAKRHRSVDAPRVSRVLARPTGRFSASLRPRWREVTELRARAGRTGTDALRVATLKRRTPWTSVCSSPSGAASSRRASSDPQSSKGTCRRANTSAAATRSRSSATGRRRTRASDASTDAHVPASALHHTHLVMLLIPIGSPVSDPVLLGRRGAFEPFSAAPFLAILPDPTA